MKYFLLLLLVLGSPLAAQSTLPADFGDAPSPYPTCAHQFTQIDAYRWTNIGRRVSNDAAAANPVPGGIGGDTFDDGVQVTHLRPAAGSYFTAELRIDTWNSVYGADAMGVWMDFNNDGDWDDPDEQVVYALCGYQNQITVNRGYFGSGWNSWFRITLPQNPTAPLIMTRVRVWNSLLSTGVFVHGQGMGAPGGMAVGGECEDYALRVDSEPQCTLADRFKNVLQDGDISRVGMLQLNQPVSVEWYVWNFEPINGPWLTVDDVVITAEVGCTVVIASPARWPQAVWNDTILTLELAITALQDHCSFTVTINSDDPDEPARTFHVAGTRGLHGTYVIDNTPNATADFTSFGAAIDEMERGGLLDHVVFEVKEGPTPYVSDESCGLGLGNHLESDQVEPAWDNYYFFAWGSRTITFRAAAGEHPVIEGDGAKFRYLDNEYHATLAFGAGHVILEGLEIRGGRDFGVALLSDYRTFVYGFEMRRCQVHDITGGPGLFALANMDAAYGYITIEGNFFWNCGVGQAVAIPYPGNGTLNTNILTGVITMYGSGPAYIRHNTILANGPTLGGGAVSSCISFVQAWAEELTANVFIQKQTAQPFLFTHFQYSDEPWASDLNCYQGPSICPIAMSAEPAGNIPNMGAWQGMGRDLNGMSANAKVRSIVAPVDLHLTTASPCMDHFLASTPIVDIDGDVRPQRGGMDIGADEVPPDPATLVERGGITINDGATDSFGSGIPVNMPFDFVYTITNNGQGPLQLTGSPRIVVTAQPQGVVASIVNMPAASIAPNQTVQFIVRVTTPTAAIRLNISFESNDPLASPYNWVLVCDSLSLINVTAHGVPVSLDQTLQYDWGTTVEQMQFEITVLDSDIGQTVALVGTVGGGGSLGFNNTQWSKAGILTPYSVTPTSGQLSAKRGSIHLVTLIADSGVSTVTFTFTIIGSPAATMVEFYEGGVSGHVIANATPAAGTPRSFSVRDIKGGPSPVIEIAIKNMGLINIEVGGPVISGTQWRDFHVNTGGYVSVLPPGTATTFYISFDPTDVGSRTALLEIHHSGINQPSPFILPLEGDAVDLPPLDITTGASLPTGRSGEYYPSVTLNVTGGMAPYSWSAINGAFPEGVALTPAGQVLGEITGGAGQYNIAVRVRDLLGNETLKQFTVQVLPPSAPGRLPNDGLSGRDNGTTACGATQDAAAASLMLVFAALAAARRRRIRQESR